MKHWLIATMVCVALSCSAGGEEPAGRQGLKIGEVTSDSAIIWARSADESGRGVEGTIKVQYGLKSPALRSPGDPRVIGTRAVLAGPSTDFALQFPLDDLRPDNAYEVEALMRTPGADAPSRLRGEFRTAPARHVAADICFTVVTGQRYETRDDERGQQIYESMLAVEPRFFVHTGDVVYYDKPEPEARNIDLARLKWHRSYAQPRLVDFHNRVPSYFLKDDHDILKDDCWPGQRYGELTWEQGLSVFREQTPSPAVPYRTVRWGKDLQIWLLEGREFRSPNNTPDGPEKTILGKQQLEWLASTLSESDATFKIVISPTPIVGPDRTNKNDNHANAGFRHEGDRLRKLLADSPNTHVVCGDRHWQYVSVDPATGLKEYSCGPTTDKHAGGWSDDQFDEKMHKFLRVKGGFLSVCVSHPDGEHQIAFRHHGVDGTVVHEEAILAIIGERRPTEEQAK